jgi:hypothetical protein
MVLRMDQISENLHYIFQHKRQTCPQQQEDAGLAQEEPHVRCGRRRSGLPAPLIVTLLTIWQGASLN